MQEKAAFVNLGPTRAMRRMVNVQKEDDSSSLCRLKLSDLEE
jgi:hypothetical protein